MESIKELMGSTPTKPTENTTITSEACATTDRLNKTTVEGYALADDEYYDRIGDTIRCKKCSGKRITDFEVFGKRQRCVCECERTERVMIEEAIKQKERMEVIEKIRSQSLLGERYKNIRFKDSDTSNESFASAMKRCMKYCDIREEALKEGYGIYIHGDSGTGKTHLTACICNELIDHFKQCMFTNFFEISRNIKSTFAHNGTSEDDMIRRISGIDFLFIDDLGAETVSKNGSDTWMMEVVFEIINKRYNDKKPTIFSSNYSLIELKNSRGYSKRIVDRIAEMSTAKIQLKGESRRQRSGERPF